MNIADELIAQPVHERESAVIHYLVKAFQPVLFMDDNDEMPMDISIFELGVSSLSAQKLMQQIEDDLGFRIDTTELYNNPTISKLSGHVYSALFDSAINHDDRASQIENRSMVDELLSKL